MLNNQPMGFYMPAVIVKDAQRHKLRVKPVDVQFSRWECTIEHEPDGSLSLRLGLMYVRGLKQTNAQALVQARNQVIAQDLSPLACRHPERSEGPPYFPCEPSLASAPFISASPQWVGSDALRTPPNDEPGPASRTWVEPPQSFRSIEDLAHRVPQLNRRDLSQLARIGALNQLTDVQHRRDAIWQAEQAGRPAGPLLNTMASPPPNSATGKPTSYSQLSNSQLIAQQNPNTSTGPEPGNHLNTVPGSRSAHPFLDASNLTSRTSTDPQGSPERTAPARKPHKADPAACHAQSSPLRQMNTEERLVADYAGTGLSIDHHPMAFRRAELRASGVLSAKELHNHPNGHRVSAAGCVIARQRPGTALGFIFLSMEDETGIANVIIHPDVYDRDRLLITREKFLLVTGKLQNQDGVIHVKAELVLPLRAANFAVRSHDFH